MEKYYYYCSEDISLIENYEKAKTDNFKGWVMHHRLETHNFDGSKNTIEAARKANTGRIMSEEARKKIAEDRKGRHWFTNGTENKFCFECPEGFVKGLIRNKERI